MQYDSHIKKKNLNHIWDNNQVRSSSDYCVSCMRKHTNQKKTKKMNRVHLNCTSVP